MGDYHHHKCKKCHHVWGHKRLTDVEFTDDRNDKIHLCPKCGEGPFFWRHELEESTCESRSMYQQAN